MSERLVAQMDKLNEARELIDSHADQGSETQMNRKKLRIALVLIALVFTGAMFTSTFLSTNESQVQENILLDLNMGLANDYEVHDPIVITSDSDFASQGWLGSGTLEDPYLIDGLSIEGAYLESCIEIADTRAYFVVSNCLLYGTEGVLWHAGLYLTNVTNGVIEQNAFTQNEKAIHLRRSQNNTIRSNTFYANEGRSIYVDESDNNTLTDNDISDNYSNGIYVFDSNWVKILNNTCNQNLGDGIYVSAGFDSYSRNCAIANNTCEGNTGRGIMVYSCAFGVVTNNTCSGNSDGLYVGSSTSMTVTENVFAENSDGISLVMSSDISVTWNALIDNEDSVSVMSTTATFDYNYWSDYTGVDEDGDGIGDTPYYDDNIFSDIVDNHPLMYWPWYEPTTTTTTDETTDGQPGSPVIVGAMIGLVCIIIVIVLAQWRRK